jgi:hypothetical protein
MEDDSGKGRWRRLRYWEWWHRRLVTKSHRKLVRASRAIQERVFRNRSCHGWFSLLLENAMHLKLR